MEKIKIPGRAIKELEPKETIILVYLIYYSRKGVCDITYEQLIKKAKMHYGTVKKLLGGLERKGYITIEGRKYGKGYRHYYRLADFVYSKDIVKRTIGYSQKDKNYININNNNKNIEKENPLDNRNIEGHDIMLEICKGLMSRFSVIKLSPPAYIRNLYKVYFRHKDNWNELCQKAAELKTVEEEGRWRIWTLDRILPLLYEAEKTEN